jgi:DNA repair exonuclease SbcCD ATPase subunit
MFMETGGASALTIIFWILAANVILILSAYGLYKLLRQKSRDTIARIGEQIQEYASQMNQLASFLHSYAGIDQEPYFTPLNELQSEASELEARLQQFLDTCRAFEEEICAPSGNQLQEIINAPIIWLRRWRRAQELRHESVAIAGQMEAAEKRMHSIYELPWELATESRHADRQYGELVEAAQELQKSGAQGAVLQQLINQLPLLQRAIGRIPDEFMEAGHEKLLTAANMQTTIQVFESLTVVRPALDRYLPQTKEWVQLLKKSSVEYTELKQTGAKLRQSLQNPPPGLEISPLKTRLDQAAQMAAEAGQALAQPQVEQIKPLAREISQLLKVVQDTERQYHQAQQQVGELNSALSALATELHKIAAQLRDLENRSDYPLVWDHSSPLLQELRQRLAAVGPADSPRTPDQVKQHLKEMQGLQVEAKSLAEKTPKTAASHSQLVAILESPRVNDGAGWLRKSREMLAETDAFDAKNWPRQDALPALQLETQELSQQHAQLIPADSHSPVMETGLEQRLKDTQALSERHKNLYPRVDAVRARLEKLQAIEEECKEKLTEAWNALDQAGLLCESNALLTETADEEISQLMEEIRVLGNEINAREQGEVEKKAQKINSQVERVNQAFNSWLARLDGAVAVQARQIRDRLLEVDTIALLDDPPIEQARTVLEKEDLPQSSIRESGAASPAAPAKAARAVVERVAARIPRFEHKSVLNNLEAMTEIKRKNDLWQTLSAVHKGLEERSAPLLAAYQEALQARSESKERVAEVEKMLAEKRVWPPNNQSASQESQSLQPIEEKWNELKKQRVSAEWVILELGRLAQQYQLAAERVQHLLDRAKQDQEKVQDLEWQIETLKQRWLTQSEPSNPLMRESIRQLLSQSDSKLSYIKQQYLRGTLSYSQAVQNLQLLYDELHAARVPVDEQKEVGLNESHRRIEQA